MAVFAHPDDETFGPGGTLAKYAAAGVEVHCICATKGEAGEVPAAMLEGFGEVGELRAAELTCAARILGIKEVHFLGYRDSGMPGSADNHHPRSLQQAKEEEVVEKIVALIRRLRPQALITFDPHGGYGHPDHVKIHRLATQAFFAAGDPNRFSHQREQGLAPHRTPYLYYTLVSRRVLRFWLLFLPLVGRDPSRFGLNQDIDLREVASWDQPVHVRIDVRPFLDKKIQAAACHRSQASFTRDLPLPAWLRRWLLAREDFLRVYPQVKGGGRIGKDLFADELGR
jgi:LmbE family N-acetylglucosaminyl deacetylase